MPTLLVLCKHACTGLLKWVISWRSDWQPVALLPLTPTGIYSGPRFTNFNVNGHRVRSVLFKIIWPPLRFGGRNLTLKLVKPDPLDILVGINDSRATGCQSD